MIREQLACQRLVAGEREPAGVAARVRHPEELEVADYVLIEHDDVVERLEEVEYDRGSKLLQGLPDGREVVVHLDEHELVATLAERGDDVPLHAPLRIDVAD